MCLVPLFSALCGFAFRIEVSYMPNPHGQFSNLVEIFHQCAVEPPLSVVEQG